MSKIVKKIERLDALNELTETQQKDIQFCIDQLTELKNTKEITEATWRQLSNVLSELNSLRELFFLRIINCLRRSDMLLD